MRLDIKRKVHPASHPLLLILSEQNSLLRSLQEVDIYLEIEFTVTSQRTSLRSAQQVFGRLSILLHR